MTFFQPKSEAQYESDIIDFLENWEAKSPPTLYAIQEAALGNHSGYDSGYIRFHLALFTLLEDGLVQYKDGFILAPEYDPTA